MKPIKLKISGLNSFIQTQTIDFDALGKDNLFCISGSTGSGKTTIVDAIILALYGETNRGNLVDAINLTCQKAVVELTIELEGQVYIIVREIRRKSGNLARMYKENGEIIADTIKAVDAFVLSKIGLEKEQFTKVVMLQQGEFDKFLSDNRNDRMKVIEKLTDIGNYKKAIELINADERDAKTKLEIFKTQLETYNDVSDEILAEKYAQYEEKTQTEKQLISKKTELAQNAETVRKKLASYQVFKEREEKILLVKSELDKIQEEFEILANDKKNLVTYTAKLDKAVDEIAQNGKKRESMSIYLSKAVYAEEITLKIDKALSDYRQALQDRQEKEKALLLYKEKADKIQQKYGFSKDIAKEVEYTESVAFAQKSAEFARQSLLCENYKNTQKEMDSAQEKFRQKSIVAQLTERAKNERAQELEQARERVKKLEIEVEKMRADNALGVVLSAVKVGDVCPICGEVISSLNHVNATADASQAIAQLKTARNECDRAQETLKNAESAHFSAINEYAVLSDEIEKLKAKAEELKNAVKVTISESELKESEERLKSAKEFANCVMQINSLTDVILDKDKDLEKRRNEGEELRKEQTQLKNIVFENCGTFASKEIQVKIEKLRSRDLELEREKSAILELIKNISDREIQLCEKKKNKLEVYENLKKEHTYCEKVDQDAVKMVEIELEQTEKDIIKIVSDKSALQTRIKDLEGRLKEKKEKESQLCEKENRYATIKELKELVKGSAFTDFVADAFVEDITLDASTRMSNLSSGQYALYYCDGEFFVKDYFSSGESRNVSTLSGGEKFLASLSLAIAISRRTAQSKDYGFFFIDEGFGTLDENALETVCASLETLAQDTVVGVITHRSELIERIPSVLQVEKSDGESGSKCVARV